MISIAMATYNGEEFIKEQLDSILQQTYKDFELIICDDCSKDKTLSILNDYANKDNRIKVFVNHENLGFKKNFENAIKNCTGDYIAFCDQDDIWTPDHLEILYSEIDDKDLICGNAELIDKNGNKMGMNTYDCLTNFILPYTNIELFLNLLHGNFAQGTATMISKRIISQLLPIPEDVKYHDSWTASIAALNNGCKYTDKIVLYYRQHTNNQTITGQYSIIHAIKNSFEKKELLKLEYKEKILFAQELLQRTKSPDYIRFLNETINYFNHLLSKSFKALKYFNKHYKSIYWVRNPSKKLYLLRFIKIFILHI